MSFDTLRRCAMAFGFVALVTGCSSASNGGASGGAASGGGILDAIAPLSALKCKVSRSSCMYEGAYEPGERDYAEQEAKRLNKAASEKFLRSIGK